MWIFDFLDLYLLFIFAVIVFVVVFNVRTRSYAKSINKIIMERQQQSLKQQEKTNRLLAEILKSVKTK